MSNSVPDIGPSDREIELANKLASAEFSLDIKTGALERLGRTYNDLALQFNAVSDSRDKLQAALTLAVNVCEHDCGCPWSSGNIDARCTCELADIIETLEQSRG